MLLTWIKRRRDNNPIFCIEINNEVFPIKIKRISNANEQIRELVNRKEFENNIGFFKYKTNSFNSILLSMNVDLIFADEDGFVINIQKDFEPNKISDYVEKTKFLYIFAAGFVDNLNLKKGAIFRHYRSIEKSWYE